MGIRKSISSIQHHFKKAILVFSIFFLSSLHAQNLISVPFTNGFVGNNVANNSSDNAYYLSGVSGLGWSNVQFTQNSSSTIFVAQGNDIIGTVLITDNNGTEHSIDGFIKWRAPSFLTTRLRFQRKNGRSQGSFYL